MDNKGALNTTSAVDTSNGYGDQVMESVSDVFAESRFYDYTLDKYSQDVEKRGLSSIWKLICDFILKHGETKGLLQIKNFGELYEIGLAAQDKNKKKKNGQYFTPDDVALVMSKWLRKEEGTNVCDVGCGTGRLILTYLSLLGYDEARKLISSGNLYLYDLDSTALMICKTSIAVIYGVDILSSIHGIVGDFLSDIIHLPSDSKVISNPPYAPIDEIGENWADEDGVIKESMELYSAFMDKEFRESKSTVIITPFSFISSPKFQNLRYAMCQMGNGFIVAFDNVPGNIFCGKKKGIFNTNTANSVRASITVFRKNNNLKGFRVTHLIRFKGKERKNLLIPEKLESYLSTEYQIVDSEHPMFKKVDKDWKRSTLLG
jgi:SAM-dependent methyltransferase